MNNSTPIGTDVLSVRGISKTFTGTKALDSVDFSVRAGEVHALLGGNGSGKSTLIKILAGVHVADAGGMITVDGHQYPAEQLSAATARAGGLRFVHQNLGLFPDMTIAENISAGGGFVTRRGRIRWKQVNDRAAALIEKFSIRAAGPTTILASLRPADRTLVAIARALQDQDDAHSGVLFLDEPTTALPPHEVDVLLTRLRGYASAGQAIVLVSHRLPEILQVADRVTVLRDGLLAATTNTAGLAESGLVELIVGRPVGQVYPPLDARHTGPVSLRVRGLSGGPVKSVDLDVRRGEVIGVAGLLGAGRSSLLHLLMGVHKASAGTVVLDGVDVTPKSVNAAMSAGFALVPEDRAEDAAFLDHSVGGNLSAAQVKYYWRGLRLRHLDERLDALASIRQFAIKAAADQPIQTLSGGNQQKVILARWLRRNPAVLLLDEPTQGVDIGARVEIYKLIRKAADDGAIVIVVSSDFDELSHLCSRVVVMNSGSIVAEATGDELEPARLTELSFTTGCPAPDSDPDAREASE